MTKKFNVYGMTCSACSAHVEKAVSAVDGVKSVNVNLMTESMSVDYDKEVCSEEAILKAVANAGYTTEKKSGKAKDSVLSSLIASFVFLLLLMYVTMGKMFGLPYPKFFGANGHQLTYALTQLLLVLPIVYLNRHYYINGYKRLFQKSPNMDSLIALGSSSALIYGIFALYMISEGFATNNAQLISEYSANLYFESAGMILTLISLGKYMESRSKKKTSDTVKKLSQLSPKQALVERNGREVLIPSEDVSVGDIVIVKAGEGIPVDGVITEGSPVIDESAVTGESIPVEKSVGDKVTGATLNTFGYFKMRAENVGKDTVISKIIELVEDASASKAPIAKIADKVSGVFVPIVMAIAFVTFFVWLFITKSFSASLNMGISVLVISCPCALGLATPTAIMVGTGKAAEMGMLVKSAEILEITHKATVAAFDKTGTLTNGTPEITDIEFNIPKDEFYAVASSIEALSEHPLSLPIAALTDKRLSVSEFERIPGRGLSGIINGDEILAGNARLMKENKIEIRKNNYADDGKTVLYFAKAGKQIGLIALSDTIKTDSKLAINMLHKLNIKTIMITGDNKTTASAIKEKIGIDEMYAEVMPEDKEKIISGLRQKGETVIMVGDGINDAPALVSADIGMAIGNGTDIAIDSADIILMRNSLTDVVNAVMLSKKVLKNIKENLFWAFFYNVLGIPVAAGVFVSSFGLKLTPSFAALAMSFSSVFVVSNALRLRYFKEISKTQKNTEVKKMKKTVKIEGMACSHCSRRVSEVLNAIDGVSAEVNLENKEAIITLEKNIPDDVIISSITNAGYKVVSIE